MSFCMKYMKKIINNFAKKIYDSWSDTNRLIFITTFDFLIVEVDNGEGNNNGWSNEHFLGTLETHKIKVDEKTKKAICKNIAILMFKLINLNLDSNTKKILGNNIANTVSNICNLK